MNRRLAFAALFVFSLLLSACGNKGPLVLPDKPADAATPAEQPADANTDEPDPAAEPAPPASDDSGTPAG